MRLYFALATAWTFVGPTTAPADDGLVRFSGKAGNYQITVLTSPTPFRAGPVEIGVLVQAAELHRPLPDAEVTVEVSLRDEPGIQYRGTTRTDKLVPSVSFDLPQGGWWRIRVAVAGRLGDANKTIELEADDPLPAWRELSLWICLPVLPILLYVAHQWLVRRRERSVAR
ncbi:MAG: hypothetical protein FJ271_04985 [Planctomycetes bacterium]|nr:hypothetical protein [Planctomycetota bacterium]